jgi:phage terminase small subunit
VLAHPSAQKPLDLKEAIFVSTYIKTKNCRRSAIEAGYSEAYAASKACHWVKPNIRLNKKLNIFAAIHSHSTKIQQKAVNTAINRAASSITREVIDSQWVLKKSVEHFEKSSGEIPTHISRMVDPLTGAEKIIEHFDYDGNQVAKGIEMVAKNRLVKAFSNEIEINTDSSLAQLLLGIGGQSGPPTIARDIIDAEIVEPVQLERPPSLPEQ